MNATKRIISDQVLYRIAGGIPGPNFHIREEDIWKALEQKLNSLFQLKHFDTTLPSGETIPDNLSLGIYENIEVLSYSVGKSRAQLPVIPVTLPRNMGVFLVYDPNYPDYPFIPLQRGQKSLLQSDALLGDLMGLVSYEPMKNALIFSRDLPTLGVSEVTMELVVFDISTYSVTDPLPIPANYEQTIIDEIVAALAPIVPDSGLVNNFANPNEIRK